MNSRRAALVMIFALVGGSVRAATGAGAAVPATKFANCTAMHKRYPHGVGRTTARDHVTSGRPVTNFYRSNPLYAANTTSDRDHDGVACEAH